MEFEDEWEAEDLLGTGGDRLTPSRDASDGRSTGMKAARAWDGLSCGVSQAARILGHRTGTSVRGEPFGTLRAGSVEPCAKDRRLAAVAGRFETLRPWPARSA